MNRHSSDQDLLLLAHGELSVGRRVMTEAHIALCAFCQGRLAKMTGASRLLADAIRGPDLPHWSPPGPQKVAAAARAATLRRIGFAILLLLSVLVTMRAVQVFHSHNQVRQPVISGDCRPDLPNDKCR